MSARRRFARRHGVIGFDRSGQTAAVRETIEAARRDARARGEIVLYYDESDRRKGASSVDNFAEQSRRAAQVAQVFDAALSQYGGAPHTAEDIARAMLAMDRMLSRPRVSGYEVNLAQSGRMAPEGWEGGELAHAVAESDKWEAGEHAEQYRAPLMRLTVDGATHDVTSLEIDGRKYSGVNTGRTPVRSVGEEHVATVDLHPLRICDCEVCRG